MARWIPALALVLVLGAVAPSQAFMGGGPAAKFFTEFKPVVGSWAEYVMTSEGEPPVTMRISIVGKEGELYWYEMLMIAEKQERIVTKILVTGNPQESANLKRFIVKAGDEPAMEMPIEMTRMGASEDVGVPEPTSVDKGVESVTVPAGTFKASHWLYTVDKMTSDVWVVQGIGPYGLVKSRTEDIEVALKAYGDDATSLITETPQMFSMPMGMPTGMPPGAPPQGSEGGE